MQYSQSDNMICSLFTASVNNSKIKINELEIASIDYLKVKKLLTRLERNPSQFTSWFKEQLFWFVGKPHKLLLT